jgi:predicted phosphodiesterase
MKYAVLSDVHANLEALDAVLAAARAAGVDRVVCLGDLTGYHADPNACIDRLREEGVLCVAGNHDRVATGAEDAVHFTGTARRAILWTRGQLTRERRRFLAGLPLTSVVDGQILLFHAALHPVVNTSVYLTTRERVARTFEVFLRSGLRLAFFGHTHHPLAYARRDGALRVHTAPDLPLDPGAYYLVNPGSVGQSRDADPRASFLLADTERRSVRFCRVEYDRAACMAKAARAGLLDPEPQRGRSLRRLGAFTNRG